MSNLSLETPKKLPNLTPYEVVIHNTAHDCWISFLGKVFDITSVIKEHQDENCIRPLLVFAGKDISHWFDENTGEIRHFVHPITGVEIPYCPYGRIPDVNSSIPTTLWRPLNGLPWWKNDKLMVGYMTKKVIPMRILNMLTFSEIKLNVCVEDTFERIQERYSSFNSDSDSYTWMYGKKKIDMTKTLDENGIIDDRELLVSLGIPKNYYVPVIFLYYNDDLKYFENLTDNEEEEDYDCK